MEHFRLGQRIDDLWYPLDKDIPIGSLPSATEPDSEAQNSPADDDDSNEEQGDGEDATELSPPKQSDVEEIPPPRPKRTALDPQPTKPTSWYCVGLEGHCKLFLY